MLNSIYSNKYLDILRRLDRAFRDIAQRLRGQISFFYKNSLSRDIAIARNASQDVVSRVGSDVARARLGKGKSEHLKIMARKIGWRIYHFVHTNGSLADFVYWSAYYVEKNWRRFEFRWLVQRHITPDELFPYRHLELSAQLVTGVTNICNAKCTFCAYPKVIAKRTLQTGVMSFEVFKKAVDEWVALRGHSLDLTPVVGDPLVDPGILEKVNYAVRAGLKDVHLTTNAILINRDDTYKKLIDIGIAAVFISTQGANKEVYQKIYGVNRYDEAMAGIRNLMEYNRSKGEPARIVVRFRNHEKPSQVIRSPDFKKYIRPYLSERVRINFTVDFDNWGGMIRDINISGFMKLRELPPQIDLPCQGLFGFAIRHDGNVRLCGCRLKTSDLDDLVVGNIRKKSLGEISKSEEAWKIINGFYSGKRPETCVGCTLYRPINRRWLDRRANN
jgi:MoaA/NifB/PqqE/SkfB family radical SAM enzyme